MTQTLTLLSAADEIRLAKTIEAGLMAAELLADGDLGLARADDLLLLKRAGEAAWQEFLLANVRLVQSVAAPIARRSDATLDELFQEGFLGLIDALLRWDFLAGYRFSTYAMTWIRRRVTNASVATEACGPGSARTALRARRVRGLADELKGELWREASDHEVATLVGRSAGWVGRMRALQSVTTLEAEWIAAPDAGDSDLGPQVMSLLPDLPWLERQVVGRRFGFDGAEPLNQRDAAVALGLSLSTVRRHEARALRRLRGWLSDDLAA